jgi:hypothetical protein
MQLFLKCLLCIMYNVLSIKNDFKNWNNSCVPIWKKTKPMLLHYPSYWMKMPKQRLRRRRGNDDHIHISFLESSRYQFFFSPSSFYSINYFHQQLTMKEAENQILKNELEKTQFSLEEMRNTEHHLKEKIVRSLYI